MATHSTRVPTEPERKKKGASGRSSSAQADVMALINRPATG